MSFDVAAFAATIAVMHHLAVNFSVKAEQTADAGGFLLLSR
jgi:hypothetical protein